MDSALIIFIKNPVPGKVKTRLAVNIGNKKAYVVYKNLLNKTIKNVSDLDVKKEVWYSEFIDRQDHIDPKKFDKKKQKGRNLGERMSTAFTSVFNNGFGKAVIIGSDCPELTAEVIEEAYAKLDESDLVLGPSMDGGYYLLGMKKNHSELFTGIEWSTETVYKSTVQKAELLNLTIATLPVLNDIDTLDDLEKSRFHNELFT